MEAYTIVTVSLVFCLIPFVNKLLKFSVKHLLANDGQAKIHSRHVRKVCV